jgi:hypothetical protein
MKRYLVFAGVNYYPSGGWGDFHGDFDSIEEGEASLRLLNNGRYRKWEWMQILDTQSLAVVKEE